MTRNNYSDYAVHVMPVLRRTKGVTHGCLAFDAYHKNQSTNHIEADSCGGKKLPKYYLFLIEHLYLPLVIYL